MFGSSQTLKDQFLKTPNCQKEWLSISKSFENKRDFPHCLGSLDGKNIRIECPKMPGTYYYNYKDFYSIILLAICDSNYCFTLFDLGQYLSNNECGVLANSTMGEMMENDKLGIPAPSKLISSSFDPLPYFFVGHEIFPLKTWLMRPLPGKLDENQQIFNYRLSRARVTIENTFGMLATRWRIFYTPIRASVENVEKYTLACLGLHNYLCLTNNATYCPFGFVDSLDSGGKLKQGEWRTLKVDKRSLLSISRVQGSRYGEDAIGMRNALIE